MPEFADYSDMKYDEQVKVYDGSEPLAFDTRYRMAQLPLIDGTHPACINEDPDQRYRYGKRAASQSLVIPVDGHALAENIALRTLFRDMRRSPIGDAIMWQMEEMRRGLLHATVCGLLNPSPTGLLPRDQRHALSAIGSFHFKIQGLFVGTFNTGRIYLCLFPELRGGAPVTDMVSAALGAPSTRLLLCGLLNLKRELDQSEAALLTEFCVAHRETVFGIQLCSKVDVLESQDDLVLYSRVLKQVDLIK